MLSGNRLFVEKTYKRQEWGVKAIFKLLKVFHCFLVFVETDRRSSLQASSGQFLRWFSYTKRVLNTGVPYLHEWRAICVFNRAQHLTMKDTVSATPSREQKEPFNWTSSIIFLNLHWGSIRVICYCLIAWTFCLLVLLKSGVCKFLF